MRTKFVILILLVIMLVGLTYEVYTADSFRKGLHGGEGEGQVVANE